MMHLDEGKLRAYLDQALSAQEIARVKKQLAGSPDAQVVLIRLSQERDDFASQLKVLAPAPAEQANTAQAWQHFQANNAGQSMPIKAVEAKERIMTMMNQPFVKRYQPAIIIFSVVAILAIALSFAPVRAAAGNLLKMFRVQTVKVIPVDKADMEALKDNPNLKTLIDQLKAQIEVTDSEPEKVDSLDQAARRVGFQVAQITALPDDVGEPTITVTQEKMIELKLDKELLEAVFEAAEIEVTLPDSLEDEPIIITHPNSVRQQWHKEGAEILEFTQMIQPSVQYPDGLDLNALGVAGLQLLGMSKEEAESLGSTIDWANTMILPIPNDSKTNVSEVSVNNANGWVFNNPNAENVQSAVMWTHNGMSYFIKGDYAADQVVNMAKSVQ